ncbi:MAG: prolipoprotein diacylglyceryl transferase [Chloroflexi bacterium]|nr:prolipoprotein diacylglyceryl transferase [Chloroflexota bacterium]MCL5950413.1 prolipoprotein diacylglyceryl transferase [Chloroflexota bacterium]
MNFFPSSVAISIPLPNGQSFPIYWYGILIVTGALVGAFIATRQAKRHGIDPDHIWNALLIALILGVIGARLYHVISTPTGTNIGFEYYVQNPMEILNFRQGGLGIYGAVAGGVLALFLYARYAKLNFLQLVDLAMPGLAIGQAIGRWGNFFNQELYGFPTTLPWGIPIDAAHRLPMFADLSQYPVATARFQPTFIYESLWDLGMGLLLLYVARRWTKEKNGDLFLLWGVLYGFGRFLVEFQRPDAWMISGVATAQIVGLILVVVCGVALAYRHTGPSKATAAAQTARQRRQRQQPR